MEHAKVDLHFILDQVVKGLIDVPFLLTKDQTAYVMTKPLSTAHSQLLKKLQVLFREPCA